MLAAAAFNFKKWMREAVGFLFALFLLIWKEQYERQLSLLGG